MFTIFDALVIALLALCAYFGFNTGIVASIFYVSSGFAGMWAAHKYAGQLNMNFYLLFILAAAAVILAGFILGKVLRGLLLGVVDKVGGCVFGLALGFTIFAVALLPMSKNFSSSWKTRFDSSISVKKVLPYILKLLPDAKDLSLETVKDALPDIELPEKMNLEIDVPKSIKKEASIVKEKAVSAVKKPASKK